VYCVLCTVYPVLFTLYFVLCTVYCVLCVVEEKVLALGGSAGGSAGCVSNSLAGPKQTGPGRELSAQSTRVAGVRRALVARDTRITEAPSLSRGRWWPGTGPARAGLLVQLGSG
jgi:hypothetical protein